MQESAYTKGFPVSWEELHRTAKALAWRLLENNKFGLMAKIPRRFGIVNFTMRRLTP